MELDAFRLATFLQPNHSTLVELHLWPFPLTVSDLEQIGSFPRVTALGLLQRGPARELNKFFGVIASSFPKLCWITVTLDDEIEEEVSVAVFEDLVACRELKTVWLQSPGWKKLTREDVSRFGLWWPLMERFDLRQSRHHRGQAMTPLEILQDFAQVWSRTLRIISLPFDGSAPVPSLSAVNFKFEKLVELDVGPSCILENSVERVAEFLRAISPGYLELTALDVDDGDEADYAPLWDAVREQVNEGLYSGVVPT
ncbi:hypothetical protein FS837_006270 [Tulasnella sp. UAMH 9824]|nr:hypothetical protein FS837_006270 [Tulasnella sp. UAMH 9824]